MKMVMLIWMALLRISSSNSKSGQPNEQTVLEFDSKRLSLSQKRLSASRLHPRKHQS
jgi:hypothetical protein